MNTRRFDAGWRDGWEQMFNKMFGERYFVPGETEHEDYLLGFAGGQEAAIWWDRGYDDGLKGRRTSAPEAFLHEYLTGHRVGLDDLRNTRMVA